MQVKTREMLQLKTCVISMVLCVKVRFYRNSDAPTAVSKGSVSPNLMKTTVSETLKAQNVTGPQREATKQTPKCHLENRCQFGAVISSTSGREYPISADVEQKNVTSEINVNLVQ